MLAPDGADVPTEVPDAGCCGAPAVEYGPDEHERTMRHELTEDGEIAEGLFGDGAYVPSHWWEV